MATDQQWCPVCGRHVPLTMHIHAVTPELERQAREALLISTHPWQPPHSASSNLCGAMVMRDGGGDECGLPRNHPKHQEGAQ